MLLKLLLDVHNELFEVLLVIQDQLWNNSFVDFNRWEFILRVFYYHRCKLREMLGNFGSASLDYKKILVPQFIKELGVLFDAIQKRFRCEDCRELLLGGLCLMIGLWVSLALFLLSRRLGSWICSLARLCDQELRISAWASLWMACQDRARLLLLALLLLLLSTWQGYLHLKP